MWSCEVKLKKQLQFEVNRYAAAGPGLVLVSWSELRI